MMTDADVAELIRQFAKAKGGTVTEQELDCMTAILEEHWLTPEEATLEEALKVLGLA